MIKKTTLFALQREYCAPGTQPQIVDFNIRVNQELEKSFCALGVYPNTLHLDNTRPQ